MAKSPGCTAQVGNAASRHPKHPDISKVLLPTSIIRQAHKMCEPIGRGWTPRQPTKGVSDTANNSAVQTIQRLYLDDGTTPLQTVDVTTTVATSTTRPGALVCQARQAHCCMPDRSPITYESERIARLCATRRMHLDFIHPLTALS